MVEYYTILGRKVGSHIVCLPIRCALAVPRRRRDQCTRASFTNTSALQLAMATLGSAFVGGYFGLSGGKKPEDKAKGPPINASSKDEEKFIKYVLTEGSAAIGYGGATDGVLTSKLWQLTQRTVSSSRNKRRATNTETEQLSKYPTSRRSIWLLNHGRPATFTGLCLMSISFVLYIIHRSTWKRLAYGQNTTAPDPDLPCQ